MYFNILLKLPHLRSSVFQNSKKCSFVTSSKHNKCLDISGIYPPIASPFKNDENIDWENLRKNIELWNTIKFAGYVVQGSNGEFVHLDLDERIEMVSQVKKWASSDKLIIAGSGCESTRQTINVTNRMADAGADAALVVTPSYYKGAMTESAFEQHYLKVADSSKIPIILYSVPPNTNIDLPANVIIRLSSHPNIIGLKDSGGDVAKLSNLVRCTKENQFQILAGSAGFLFPALTMGCVGGVLGVSNILGQETVELYHLSKSNDTLKAVDLQARLIAPNSMVTRTYGIAGLKYAMDKLGYYGGPLRSPLLPLNEEQKKHLENVFAASGFSFE